jgi:oligoribonuclease NrnB/cAMP/cGMP phosphodiesterase (DHH superfamily)
MDGTGAKYAAWRKFGDEAKYIAVNYGRQVPTMEPGSDVYILDFSYPRNVLQELQNAHNTVVVLDHHKTAEEALRGLKGCHFDMHKSGAVMAWEYFHPEVPVPVILSYVQDRDLWKWEMQNTAAVHMGLQTLKGDMYKWNQVSRAGGHFARLMEIGKVLKEKQDQVVENAVKNHVKVIDFCGYKVGVTNQSDNASEIGNAICISKDLNVAFAVVYCITNEDDVLLSFRSEGDFDVSTLAKKFGGGGHKNAAGAKVTIGMLAKILNGDL